MGQDERTRRAANTMIVVGVVSIAIGYALPQLAWSYLASDPEGGQALLVGAGLLLWVVEGVLPVAGIGFLVFGVVLRLLEGRRPGRLAAIPWARPFRVALACLVVGALVQWTTSYSDVYASLYDGSQIVRDLGWVTTIVLVPLLGTAVPWFGCVLLPGSLFLRHLSRPAPAGPPTEVFSGPRR